MLVAAATVNNHVGAILMVLVCVMRQSGPFWCMGLESQDALVREESIISHAESRQSCVCRGTCEPCIGRCQLEGGTDSLTIEDSLCASDESYTLRNYIPLHRFVHNRLSLQSKHCLSPLLNLNNYQHPPKQPLNWDDLILGALLPMSHPTSLSPGPSFRW